MAEIIRKREAENGLSKQFKTENSCDRKYSRLK